MLFINNDAASSPRAPRECGRTSHVERVKQNSLRIVHNNATCLSVSLALALSLSFPLSLSAHCLTCPHIEMWPTTKISIILAPPVDRKQANCKRQKLLLHMGRGIGMDEALDEKLFELHAVNRNSRQG